MRRTRASPLTHAENAYTGTLPQRTNFYWGKPQQAGAQRMKQLSGPVAAAAIAATLFTFTAPADARTAQHGGFPFPTLGDISDRSRIWARSGMDRFPT